MQKIHPGQDVVSFFGIGVKKIRSQFQDIQVKQKMYSVIAAFFVILLAIIFFKVAAQSRGLFIPAEAGQEAVAFQPGKYIESYLGQGYLGR